MTAKKMQGFSLMGHDLQGSGDERRDRKYEPVADAREERLREFVITLSEEGYPEQARAA